MLQAMHARPICVASGMIATVAVEVWISAAEAVSGDGQIEMSDIQETAMDMNGSKN